MRVPLASSRYVERTIEAKDRRYVHLEATRRGVALLEEGRRRRLVRLSAFLSKLDARERIDCARALAVLTKAFEA